MDAQKKIDAEVAEYYAVQRERELKEHAARLEHRRQLDKVLANKKEEEKRTKNMQHAEEEEIEVFAAAKRVSELEECHFKHQSTLVLCVTLLFHSSEINK